MIDTRDILGMNARNIIYLSRYNKPAGRKVADHKLLTKSTLQKAKLSTPKLYRVFRKPEEIDKFDFINKLPESFVIKPDNSLGGEGIMVIKKRGQYAGEWITSTGETKSVADFKLLIQDILEGQFSMENKPDIAFVEERIRIHPAFEKVCWNGTPDIGVLIFNRVPVMAYLRLPTKESGGRANMFQGAIACGVDMATGITIHAVKWTHSINFFPETKRKLVGIKIPEWEEVLKLAIDCQMAIPELGFMRADIVLQPPILHPGETIPKVLELNAQPGLKIQIANQAGLRRRLERVEGLTVEDAEKGIKICKALFADPQLIAAVSGKKTIGIFENVEVRSFMGDRVLVKAKVDTGAFRTSIDGSLARKMGLLSPENIIGERHYESALGVDKRLLIDLIFWLGGRKIKTEANVADRSKLKRPMLVGRRDLTDFIIDPSLDTRLGS